MQKKEMILLASLLNALILAFLLTTAVHESIPQSSAQLLTNSLTAHAAAHTEALRNSVTTTAQPSHTFASTTDNKVIALDPWPHDEVDHALQPYLSKQDNVPEFEPVQQTPIATKAPQEDYQEVVVKRGDALDKIARQHGISVKEIKRINQLTTDRLNVGQLLILPKNQGTTETATTQRSEQKISATTTQDVQAYIMKPGDNPWKIAKTHKMKPEDLLELNGWTEESARNLKPGDSIRVYATPR